MAASAPVYAEDFPLQQIPDHLCDEGPYNCRACEAQCAFGRRFLGEIDSDPQPGKPIVVPGDQTPPRIIETQRRVYMAMMDLVSGCSREEVCVKYGFQSRKQLNDAIRYHKEKALARFGGGESAG